MNNTKVCFKCNIEKGLTEFYKHPATRDGYLNKCKECTKQDTSKYARDTGYDKHGQRYSIKRIFSHRYRGVKQRVIGNAIREYPVRGKELLTKDEFIKWCYEEQNFRKFNSIYEEWQNSGFKRMLSPSINRIDDTRGYSIDNIEWLSLSDNLKEYHKNGSIHSNFQRKRDGKGRFTK